MEKYKCCDNCKLEQFFTCKNCGIEHGHYYIYTNFVKTHYMCAFCRIETPIIKELEAKQMKLL